MGFLKRVFGGGDRGPGWTGGMSADEFRRFLDLVGDDQRRRGHTFRIEDDGLFVDRPDDEPLVFGLSNLAMLCHAISPSEWPATIASHFTNIETAIADDTDLEDFEKARPFLKVRVYGHGDFRPELVAELPKRPLTPDLFATVVLDLPTTVRTVSQKTAAEWPEPLDRIFDIGLEHLAEEVPSYIGATLTLDGGARLERLMGDSFFVASQVVRLDAIMGDAPNGAVVSMPNRHLLLWHPLRQAGHARTALATMTMLGAQAFDEGPGSLIADPHWWHRGALTPLRAARVGRDRFEPQWPDAFMLLLDSLPDGAST